MINLIKKVFLSSFLLSATSSFALSSYCFYPNPLDLAIISCKTGSVPANKEDHFVYFEVTGFCHYYVRDEQTKVIVRQGIAPWNGFTGHVFGLYGNEYTLEIRDAPACKAYINNT